MSASPSSPCPPAATAAVRRRWTTPCPDCAGGFAFKVDALLTCPECGYEWSPSDGAPKIRDAVGNVLVDRDTVTVVKDLKLRGTSSVVNVGTKLRGIHLVAGDHDIDGKAPGHGQIALKSLRVKKVPVWSHLYALAGPTK